MGESRIGVVVVSLVDASASARVVTALQHEGIEAADILVLGPDAGSVPRRRSLGSKTLTAPLLLWLEDSVALRPGWRGAAVSAFAREPRLGGVSGPLTPSNALPARDRALLVADYGSFLTPCPLGLRAALPGHALLLRREALGPLLTEQVPLREDTVFAQLRAHGRTLRLLPEMEARFEGAGLGQGDPFTLFTQARGWSGRRRAEEPSRAALRALMLPGVAALRGRRAWVDARRSAALDGGGVTARLWLAGYTAAWALGESVGALAGPGDDRGWA